MTNAKKWAKALAGTAITFGALDAAWIAGVAKNIYDAKIPHLMAKELQAAPAGVFYAGYLLGAVYLAVQPGNKKRTVGETFRDGAILGALAYGTFGFTNASVLENFPVTVAASDTAWGAFLTGTAAAVGRKFAE